MTRAQFIHETRREAIRAISGMIQEHGQLGAPRAQIGDGLLTWLLKVNAAGAARSRISDVTFAAWHERITGPALARRFNAADLAAPLDFILATRVAHVGFLLQFGIGAREIAETFELPTKHIYRLLQRLTPNALTSGRMSTLTRLRRNQATWLAHEVLMPLVERVPARAWLMPRLLRRELSPVVSSHTQSELPR